MSEQEREGAREQRRACWSGGAGAESRGYRGENIRVRWRNRGICGTLQGLLRTRTGVCTFSEGVVQLKPGIGIEGRCIGAACSGEQGLERRVFRSGEGAL